MFDVTVYTDARAAEALDGVAGFNFIAASSGITAAEQKFVAQRMLHVVKSSWHVDNSDELAHPPSCIYRPSDGRFFLSRGRSIGQTVTAPRPGNQVTQTIVTSDPDDFVPYRPAQLFAASEWNLSRDTEGKQVSPWPTPLEINPAYEADGLKEALVDGSPFGPEFLPVFLTMVEQATADSGKKLIIVHTELDVVMRYIALASLFLDAGRALTMSFVAFAEQPLAAVADIVGATPHFGETPSVDSGSSAYNVVDVLAWRMSPVEVSSSAVRQAEWFIGDPFDALAAIEVARRWESALGADVATDAAGIVSFTESPVASPRDRSAALRAVCGLVAGNLRDDLAMYSDELLDAIVTSPPTCEADVRLAADAIGTSHQAGMDEVAAGILLPTLEVLASRSDLIPTWGNSASTWRTGLGPLQWESEEARSHALRAQSDIINSSGTADLADVLITAKKADLLPNEGHIALALDRLCDYWSQHPELSARKDDLPYQPVLGSRLGARIVAALERDDQAVVDTFLAGSWEWLCGPGSVLSRWQAAAAVRSMTPDRRAHAVASSGTQLPVESWKLVLDGLDMPTGAPVIVAWFRSHADVPADLSSWIYQGLTASQARHEDGDAARRVISAMREGRIRTSDAKLERLLTDVDQIAKVYQEAERRIGDDRNPALHDIATRVRSYVAFFGPELGTLLVKSADRRGVQQLERVVGDWVAPFIDAALTQIARREGDAGSLEWALSLYESGTEPQREAATEFLLALMDSRTGRQRLDESRANIARSWIPVLDGLIEESRKGRLTRNIMRGGKRLFTKDR
ncbi:hypothetical protein A5699_05745 [Mycobacterium sp. E802]|uniref:GAP1-N2 domain-containing protein n=1 Tax=Mycobacterium sp. E802 TaxID=1834152 RepID=UPI0007FC9DBE|nr:hypothetical protein [Mycobacterium sp. E802]OBG82653.1 hypothetical protein A5699_05745 [Mycobacterium sp. E802]